MVKCYVINMEKDHDRREFITAQLDNLGMAYTFFKGVYGKGLSAAELEQHYNQNKAQLAWRELTLGEIGCALSHIGIWRDMVENGVSHALILEDDAQLSKDVPRVLEKLAACFLPDQPILTLLTRVKRYRRKNCLLLDGFQVAEIFDNSLIYGDVFGAHGYFLTQRAAQRMLEQLYPVWIINDFWPKFRRMGLVDVRAVVPYCISHSHFSIESNIEEDRQNLEMEKFVRDKPIRYVFFRYFYQKFIFQLFVRPFLKNQRKTW